MLHIWGAAPALWAKGATSRETGASSCMAPCVSRLLDTPSLSADCARCASLCCRYLAFDRSESFGFDKVAGETCRNLLANHRCGIHARRAALGFSGCVSYDCYGAGQVATALFAGGTLETDATLSCDLASAFSVLRDAHELLLLLRATNALQLSAEQRVERAALQRLLAPKLGWSRQTLREFELCRVRAQVAEFLRGLRAQGHALQRRLRTLPARACP